MNNQKPPEPASTPNPAATRIENYFRVIRVLNAAFSGPGKAFRDTHASLEPEAQSLQRTVFWLGCNVLRTPHLAQLAMAVMELVAPHASVLGGRSHCCGSPMPEQADRERAMAETIGHFQQEHADTVVSWCPSCYVNLRKHPDQAAWKFEELHITEFLSRHLDRMKLKQVSARVMLHGHTGMPARDHDMDCCRQLLQAIPGVTIVGEHADPDLGHSCFPALAAPHLGPEGYREKLDGILSQARQCGAEMLVTIYHPCYRELEKRVSPGELVIENYITLLAKALDLPVAENVYREIAHADSARLAKLACDAEARGISQADLQDALAAEFPRPQLADL